MLKSTTIAVVLMLGTIVLSERSVAWMNKKSLFSALQGVVLLEGSPVKGAQIERIYHWGWTDEEKKQQTTTDESGRFAFSEATGSTLLGAFLPHEPVIHQDILIHYAGKTYEAWKHTKHNYDSNGELQGKPLAMVCELTNQPVLNEDIKVYGICQVQ